jgi:quercetin dioxygenase-like cupin family protein
MAERYTFLADLAKELTAPADGILSRTLLSTDRLKVVGFGFAAGEELSEHTAAFPAILHILSGEGTLALGADTKEVAAGAWAHMPAHLTHAVRARTPVTMLLLLLK